MVWEGLIISLLASTAGLSAVTASDAVVITEAATFALSETAAYDVLSGREIEMALELEGRKLSAGCSTEAACLAEIAGAMDARYVLFGSIAVIDGTQGVLSMSLYDSREAKTVGRARIKGESVGALSEQVGPAARAMVQDAVPTGTARLLVLPFVTSSPNPAAIDQTATTEGEDKSLVLPAAGLSLGLVAAALGTASLVGAGVIGWVVFNAHNTAHDANVSPVAAQDALALRDALAPWGDGLAGSAAGLFVVALGATAVGMGAWLWE